jgi:hypothetical protein
MQDSLMHRLLPPLADLLGGSLGLAAVALVLGWVFLSWQRDRHRFVLMRTALEKGMNRFPDAPPFWLLSFRQGLTMTALGVALAAVGAGSYWLGHSVPAPSATAIAQDEHQQEPPPPPPRPGRDGPQEGPRDGQHEGPRDGRPPRPPAQNPEMERWHNAQVEVTLGLGSAAIGIILGFVGMVRIVFARTEREYATDDARRDDHV